ncbi:cleavage and polyadenylation specificity factor A subunit protein [Striga asiatica]|uniref:Cleavage and polyadenylation specificity factor A subunit protein n=1 Tax=Striga asiatica TaxID=4170 RepID=A0A5A7Q1E2_STRAF|nr:cleavage and polyadenylation specificity factor A subunit protein [Striga asiatica]
MTKSYHNRDQAYRKTIKSTSKPSEAGNRFWPRKGWNWDVLYRRIKEGNSASQQARTFVPRHPILFCNKKGRVARTASTTAKVRPAIGYGSSTIHRLRIVLLLRNQSQSLAVPEQGLSICNFLSSQHLRLKGEEFLAVIGASSNSS